MGQVWVARQTGKHGFERLVAVKTVLPRFAFEERTQLMFLDEVRVASRVEHANVAKILDVGEQDNTTYLVMEYVDGEAFSVIRDALRSKGAPIPPGILLRVMSDVCAGLQAAHELRDREGQLLGVVHRDISPQNILLSTKGEAKLIDFGLAKARNRISGDTSEGTLKGKIRYMAPEQAFGRAVDRRTDLWSIGAVLHDALTGRPPYDGENETQILHHMMSRGPHLCLPASVHPAIAAVVRRALVPAPSGRFATSAEMQQAMEEAMVEARIATTSRAVADFVVEHVGDRTRARKELIELALRQADSRSRLSPSSSDSRIAGEAVPSVSQAATKVLPPKSGPAEVSPDQVAMSVVSTAASSESRRALGFRTPKERMRRVAAAISATVLGTLGIIAFVSGGARAPSARPATSPPLSPVVLSRAHEAADRPYSQGTMSDAGGVPSTDTPERAPASAASIAGTVQREKPQAPPKAVRGDANKRRAKAKAIIDDGF